MVKVIAFDFDSVLAAHDPDDGIAKIGPPLGPGIALLKSLIVKGNECFIFTSRPSCQRAWIADWLEAQGIKYIRIECDKPKFDLLIDDKAMSWPKNLGA